MLFGRGEGLTAVAAPPVFGCHLDEGNLSSIRLRRLLPQHADILTALRIVETGAEVVRCRCSVGQESLEFRCRAYRRFLGGSPANSDLLCGLGGY